MQIKCLPVLNYCSKKWSNHNSACCRRHWLELHETHRAELWLAFLLRYEYLNYQWKVFKCSGYSGLIHLLIMDIIHLQWMWWTCLNLQFDVFGCLIFVFLLFIKFVFEIWNLKNIFKGKGFFVEARFNKKNWRNSLLSRVLALWKMNRKFSNFIMILLQLKQLTTNKGFKFERKLCILSLWSFLLLNEVDGCRIYVGQVGQPLQNFLLLFLFIKVILPSSRVLLP